VGGATFNMRANSVRLPTSLAAESMGDMFSIPPLLGITYEYFKALPNNFRDCLIPPMEKPIHMGVKLKQEAERLGLKPAQVAEKFGVKPPSVYDWYEHGRIHKKHYVTLIEVFGRPLDWWLDMEPAAHIVREEGPSYVNPDARHRILLDLFDGLPTKEQDELIRALTEKKQHYDAIVEELLSRRNAA
jgi:transcriptional regulator with XRE-family HTH domain